MHVNHAIKVAGYRKGHAWLTVQNKSSVLDNGIMYTKYESDLKVLVTYINQYLNCHNTSLYLYLP